MTKRRITMPNLAEMTESRRLAEAGRLRDATALIQRSLSGARETSSVVAAGRRTNENPSHAALLPGGLRDVLGQALRSLRGTAPVLKGLKGAGLSEGPQRSRESDEQFVERRFSNSAGARDYKLFIPSRQSGVRPLVIMLHGCSQSPDDFATGTRMNRLAEEDGIYVAYPRQTRSANMQKCWNWFEPGDQGRERGEAGIIAGIARTIMAEHPIDPACVYVAGLSAGGAAAANVASVYPDLFAAVGIHSGLAAGCAHDLSSAMRAMRAGAGHAASTIRVPTIVFHGEDDMTVVRRNAEEILTQAGVANLTAERESGSAHGHAYTRTRYRDETDGVRVESWLVKGAGHAWSGGDPNGSYTDLRGPDASRAMLDFFREITSHRNTVATG